MLTGEVFLCHLLLSFFFSAEQIKLSCESWCGSVVGVSAGAPLCPLWKNLQSAKNMLLVTFVQDAQTKTVSLHLIWSYGDEMNVTWSDLTSHSEGMSCFRATQMIWPCLDLQCFKLNISAKMIDDVVYYEHRGLYMYLRFFHCLFVLYVWQIGIFIIK